MKGELWLDDITSSCNCPLKYNVTRNIHVIFYWNLIMERGECDGQNGSNI